MDCGSHIPAESMEEKKKSTTESEEEDGNMFMDSSSVDSEYDSYEEYMSPNGLDPHLDRDSDDYWEPPTKKSLSSETLPQPAMNETGKSLSSSSIVSTLTTGPESATLSATMCETSTSYRGFRGRGRGRSKARQSTTFPTPHPSRERWNTVEQEDTPPAPLPFQPARKPGPQNCESHLATPLDFFKMFFTDMILANLVDNMNSFGARQFKKWTPVDITDFFPFIAIIIYMGIVRLPKLVCYWKQSSIYNIPFPPAVISRNKYLHMCRALYLCSLEDDAANQAARGTPAYDQLGKIKPLYHQMTEVCKENYHPGKNISINERMLTSKARAHLKQYTNKPSRCGYKLHVLADSETGYTWNFFVHEDKTSSSDKGLGYDSVMSLLDVQRLGTGYHLYTDNFYTSPHLFKDLLDLKIGACGTIKPTHVDFPKTKENNFTKEDTQGSIRWMRSNNLLFVKWRGSRDVSMCSTIHSVYNGDYLEHKVKEEKIWTVTKVPIPTTVLNYNKHMGGVGLSDALIGYYSVLQKTRKWYRTFFFHFIDIAIVNAFILYKKTHLDAPLSQLQFREQLVLELTEKGNPSNSVQIHPPPPKAEPHLPFYFNEDTNTPRDMAASRGRRSCKLCHRKTPVGCQNCSVPLCIVPTRNCYSQWHHDKGFVADGYSL